MPKRTRDLPSLDLLKGFEAAARKLSFTSAAAELYVTQSAISRQVKTLEDQLGVALFRRWRCKHPGTAKWLPRVPNRRGRSSSTRSMKSILMNVPSEARRCT